MSIVFKPLNNQTNECFICEMSPDVGYWDPRKFFDPPKKTKYNGRKLICRDCITAAMAEFGIPSEKSFEELSTRARELEEELAVVSQNARFTEVLREAAEALIPKEVAEPSPKKTRKKVDATEAEK